MQVVIAQQQVEVSEANAYGSWTGVMPQINATVLSGNRITSGDRPLIQNGEFIRNVPGGTSTSYSNGVSFNQTLYNGGQNWNAIRRDRVGVENARWNVRVTENQIVTNVKVQYYNLLRAMRLREVAQEQVRLSEEQLRRSESMYEIGSVAKVDVLQARAQLGQVRISLYNQDKAVRQAQAVLNNAMGVDVNAPVDIVDPIGSEPLRPAPLMSLAEATQMALGSNPTVQRDQIGIRSARINNRIARGGLWPTVTGSISYGRSGVAFRDVYGNYGQNWNVSLRLNISLPILNGTQTYAQIQQTQASVLVAEENLEQTRRSIVLAIKRALLDLETTSQVVELSNENIVAAEEGLRLAEERYRVGSGTLLDVFNAQVTLAQARSSLVSARYDYLIAQANLEDALGRQ
jgi:TolC family type I secretion outer membrane protein